MSLITKFTANTSMTNLAWGFSPTGIDCQNSSFAVNVDLFFGH